jgi:hypothetical protein
MTVSAAGWREKKPGGKVLRLRSGRYMIQQVRLIDTVEATPDSFHGWFVGQIFSDDDSENSSWRLDHLGKCQWGNPKPLRDRL